MRLRCPRKARAGWGSHSDPSEDFGWLLNELIANGGVMPVSDPMRICFFVAGTARPKGSHRAFVVAGRARVAPASSGERAWRDRVTDVAREHMQGRAPIEGPVEIALEFFTLRPKSHYRATRFVCPHGAECVHGCTRVLRLTAPPRPTSAPDGDKLWRSVGDALNGVVYRDDRQVCEAHVRKRYTSEGQPYCGVRVSVWRFEGEP